MKINKNTKINGNKILLVPYEHYHVPKYHTWMQSEELQELTASEPLSLDEEFAMQKSWREDEDKCTFIILDRRKYDETQNEIDSMIGDTNLFLNNEVKNKGEIEIMIAEIESRGKGFGWEAVIIMLLYAIDYLKIEVFEAKISVNNNKSINMFQKLGFHETQRSEIFQEVTLEKTITPEWKSWLRTYCGFEIEKYECF